MTVVSDWVILNVALSAFDNYLALIGMSIAFIIFLHIHRKKKEDEYEQPTSEYVEE